MVAPRTVEADTDRERACRGDRDVLHSDRSRDTESGTLKICAFRVTSYLKERKRTINKYWPLVSERQAEVFTG